MTDTTHLGLPLLAAGQAQKHVTHNDALQLLDAVVMCAVESRQLAAPPGSPAEGSRYLVAAGATGAWAGQVGALAAWQDGVWRFVVPGPGFLAYLKDEGGFAVFDGSTWAALGSKLGGLSNLARVGIGTSADAANPFAAKLASALWTSKGVGEGGTGDLRLTLNKESAGNVLSLLFQSGYSGRMELGLVGSDTPSLKVSADGSGWTTALSIAPTGALTTLDHLPAGDGAQSLGSGSRRWSALYAATGTINTSDGRRKTALAPLTEAELACAREIAAEIGTFAFRDAVAAKGERARRHIGLPVQAALAIFERHGLDPYRYGLVCRDCIDGEEVLGFRPDELALLLVRGLDARLAALEARAAG